MEAPNEGELPKPNGGLFHVTKEDVRLEPNVTPRPNKDAVLELD
jgi:hypothetical protein